MQTEIIYRYFPGLNDKQKQQFEALDALYRDWNEKINVVSRKDTDQLYERHVLHSLAIAKVCCFDEGARILDVGTGGGFPGIPLAIMFPGANFILADSIGKKTRVASAVAKALGLANVEVMNTRAEQIGGQFDYVVSRAVTALPNLTGWVWNKISKGQCGTLPNGMLCLKGGDLTDEIKESRRKAKVYEISGFFDEEFFLTKKIVYLEKR